MRFGFIWRKGKRHETRRIQGMYLFLLNLSGKCKLLVCDVPPVSDKKRWDTRIRVTLTLKMHPGMLKMHPAMLKMHIGKLNTPRVNRPRWCGRTWRSSRDHP